MNFSTIYKIIKSIYFSRKNGLLHLKRVSGPTRLDCLGQACALCCALGTGIILSAEDAKRLGKKNVVEQGETLFLGGHGTTCSFLQNKCCSIYQKRPKSCSEYPWYDIDGELYYDAGCPGIKHDYEEIPSRSSLTPFERFFPSTSRWLLPVVKVFLLEKD
jgi:hypothetical protein